MTFCKLKLSPSPFADAGGVQVGADPEEGSKGEASHDAALRPQATQDPDQVPGPPVEEEQHEDNVGHLPKGPPPAQRRLGLRKRWGNNSFCVMILFWNSPFWGGGKFSDWWTTMR